MDQTSKAATIAALNDRFRKEGPSAEIPGQAVLTQGIAALSFARQLQIRIEVTSFDLFEPGDDPYGEHDFGECDQPIRWAGDQAWRWSLSNEPAVLGDMLLKDADVARMREQQRRQV